MDMENEENRSRELSAGEPETKQITGEELEKIAGGILPDEASGRKMTVDRYRCPCCGHIGTYMCSDLTEGPLRGLYCEKCGRFIPCV